MYVLPCVILFLCFSVLFALRLPRLGKRELILVFFVRLFDLWLFGFVVFLFLLVSGKGCGLRLWHSLDFFLPFSQFAFPRPYFCCRRRHKQTTFSDAGFLITKTCLYKFDPLKPHIYKVKLGYTGVYIIFLISAQNIDCGYSLEPPHRGGSNEYPQSMCLSRSRKNIRIFLMVKFSVYLNRRVFVMLAFLVLSYRSYERNQILIRSKR